MMHVAPFNWRFYSRTDYPGTSNGQIDTIELVEAEEEPAVKPKERQLSYRTQVLHRVLALVVMLFILAVGIIINLLFTNLVT